jgi:hypothetical protein
MGAELILLSLRAFDEFLDGARDAINFLNCQIGVLLGSLESTE